MKLPVLRSRRHAPDGETPRRPTAPWERLLRVPRPRTLRDAIRRNPGLKLVSLVMAVFLWYSITKTERDAERIIEVPISLRRVPETLTVVNQAVKPVTVTLRGPRTILDNVDERRERVQIGLANLMLGDNRIELTENMLNPDLPRSLKVVRFDPQSVTIQADRRLMRRVPVKPDLAGSPALGYTVAESTVTPEMVEVTGPARLLEELKQVRTESVDLRGVSQSVERSMLLERIDPSVTFVPDAVRVKVQLEESIAVRDFAKVPIAAPAGVKQVQPATIDLSIRGPQRLLHNLKLDPNAATVDVSGLAPGTHTVPVQVTVPEGLTVVTRNPEKVRVRIGGRA